MNRSGDKPLLFIKKGKELIFSGEALAIILKAVLEKGRCFRFRTKGHSMNPFIKDGDKVTVILPKRSPRIGEVAVVIEPASDKFAVHRIIQKKSGGFILKGDNTRETDGFIPDKNLLGIVTKVERNRRQIKLGLGLEKTLIAVLSRKNILLYVRHIKAVTLKPLWKKKAK